MSVWVVVLGCIPVGDSVCSPQTVLQQSLATGEPKEDLACAQQAFAAGELFLVQQLILVFLIRTLLVSTLLCKN
jgi:hypothetical protein